jgi:glucose/mannose transport system substrate-binding protein
MSRDDTTTGTTRRRYLAGVASGTAAALAGCGSLLGGGESGTLEVAHWWAEGDGNKAINALIEGFKEEYPDVDMDENLVAGGAGDNLRDNIRTRIQNENPPSTWQTWPGAELQPFVEADLLNDISDSVWSENGMEDAYLQGPKDAAKFDGNYVTVPLNIHRLNNLFYNQSVVDEAGVDPASAETPGDLLDVMATIQEETDATPMAHQTSAPWSSLQLWASILLGQSGADTYQSFIEGNVSDNESAIRSALETLGEYAEYFNEDAGSVNFTEANNMIIDGDAAFIHQGDWAAGAYRGTEDFAYEEDWGHTVFPGTDGLYALNMDSFPMPVNNPSPDATKKFLRYVGTVDAQERFNPRKGSIPPRTDVPDDEFGPFLTEQKADFAEADATPYSVTHGGVGPDILSSLKSAISAFNQNGDVDAAYSGIESSF